MHLQRASTAQCVQVRNDRGRQTMSMDVPVRAHVPQKSAPLALLLELLQKFYSDLFAWKIASDGEFTTPVKTPLPSSIRRDPAARVFYVCF